MKRRSNRTVNSAKNLVTAFAHQGISLVTKFISRTVFIQVLGIIYLGVGGLFSDILTMLSLAELGIDTVMMHRLYKPLTENDDGKIQLWMKFYRSAYHLVGVAILIFGSVLIPLLPFVVKDYSIIIELGINPILIYSMYLLNSAVSYFFAAHRTAILRADQKSYITTIVSMISLVLTTALQITVLYLTKNYVLYVGVGVISGIATNLSCAIIAKKIYPNVFERTSDSLTREERKEFYKDLGATAVAKANNVVLKGTDNIVLSAFIGIVIVGVYSNYLMLYTTIKSLLASCYNAVKASMGNLFAESSIEKKYQFFKLMNFITIILYGTAAVGVGIVANEFIMTWLGRDYLIAFPFSILIGFEILFMGIKQNLNQIRNISGLFKQMWFRPLLGTIINLVVSIVLVQFIGIWGVIIGTISADVFSNFLLDPKIIYKYGFEGEYQVSDYYCRNVRYIIELCLIGFADYIFCSFVFVGFSWFSVLIHALICGFSVPCYMLFVYRKSDEAQYVFKVVRRFLSQLSPKKTMV